MREDSHLGMPRASVWLPSGLLLAAMLLCTRASAEPAFARAVQWWESRLVPLASDIQGVEPSAGLWPRIAGLIGDPARPTLWNNTRLWRGASVGALALAAASVTALVLTPRPPPVPTVVIPQPRPTPTTVATVGTAPTFTLPETGVETPIIGGIAFVAILAGYACLLFKRGRR